MRYKKKRKQNVYIKKGGFLINFQVQLTKGKNPDKPTFK